MRIFFLFLLPLLLLGETFSGYQHPERYKALTAKLRQSGVSPQRIDAIFSSEKGRERDQRALKLVGDIRQIPVQRKKEKAANDQYLNEVPYLVRHLEEKKAVYDRLENLYGVNREVAAAILLKETSLGRYKGFRHDAFTALNSLLDGLELPAEEGREKLRIERFIKMAESNLLALLLFYEQEGRDVTAEAIPSSYTGAIGFPQFMPANLPLAVSYAGKSPDLMALDDAILSVGNYLAKKGKWPERLLEFGKLERFEAMEEAWRAFDAEGNASFAYDRNAEGLPVRCFAESDGKFRKEAGYLAPYVKALMKYNFSSEYALGILKIARAAAQKRAAGGNQVVSNQR